MTFTGKSICSRSIVCKVAMVLICLFSLFFVQNYFFNSDGDRETMSQPITLGTGLSITNILSIIAEKEGFFESEGLNIKIKNYKSSGLAFDDMLAGHIEMAGVAETPIVHRSFNSDDFKIFATVMTTTNDPKIIVRKGSGITKPSDLVGKRIGVTKKYQSAHFFLHLFLLRHNISYKNVSIVHDSPPDVIDQLSGGTLDAASLFEPYASYAADALKDQALIFSEPGVYTKTFNLVSKTAFLQNNQKLIQQFLRALILAENFIQQHPIETIDYISNWLVLDKQIVENYFSFSSFDASLSNALLLSMRDQAQWIVEQEKNHQQAIPDFKKYIYLDGLTAISPARVSIEN
jgi:sulfonate transport system substrate-binding protein